MPLGEGPLRALINQYVAHCHLERPHQSLRKELLVADDRRVARDGAVRRRQRLGGMLSYYERAAD